MTVVPRGIINDLPARRGHFLLESGYHTDLWLSLDMLFLDPRAIAPLITELAGRLDPYRVSAVCGPLVGGAFLAVALAAELGSRFYFTQPTPGTGATGLFTAEYGLPHELQRRAGGERIAVVDDVISAGSSVRATIAALTAAGARTVAVGSLLVLGSAGLDYFSGNAIPVEALEHYDFTLWEPISCPLCEAGTLLEDPTGFPAARVPDR